MLSATLRGSMDDHRFRVEYGFLIDEQIRVEILNLGAYASKVRYNLGGIRYEVYVENDGLILPEDWED